MKKGKYYIDKQAFYEEYKLSRQLDTPTPKMIEYWKLLIERIARCNHYELEDDKQDCQSQAMLSILSFWKNFDESKSQDPFSYFSSFVWTGMAQGWNILHPKEYSDEEILMHNTAKAQRKEERRVKREAEKLKSDYYLF